MAGVGGWQLDLALKQSGAAPIPPPDTTPPVGSITINGGAASTTSTIVELSCNGDRDAAMALINDVRATISWHDRSRRR